jgi:hypothetical protein
LTPRATTVIPTAAWYSSSGGGSPRESSICAGERVGHPRQLLARRRVVSPRTGGDGAERVDVRLRDGDRVLLTRLEREHGLRGAGERGADLVRDRERRASLLPRLREHRHHVGRCARLRDADLEPSVEPRGLAIDGVERRRREHHRHPVRAAEEVLGIAGDVPGAAARRDQDVADVSATKQARRLARGSGLPVEQAL